MILLLLLLLYAPFPPSISRCLVNRQHRSFDLMFGGLSFFFIHCRKETCRKETCRKETGKSEDSNYTPETFIYRNTTLTMGSMQNRTVSTEDILEEVPLYTSDFDYHPTLDIQ